MTYDHQAHRKLDDIAEKIDALEKKLERLADGLDISLKPAPVRGGKSVGAALPLWSTAPRGRDANSMWF